MIPEPTAEHLFTKREAAGVLRVSEITIHRLLKSKKLGCYRVAARFSSVSAIFKTSLHARSARRRRHEAADTLTPTFAARASVIR